MTHRHSRRELAVQEQRFTWRGARRPASEERRGSELNALPRLEEVREILREQRLHFLLLERAMQNLLRGTQGTTVAAAGQLGAERLPAGDARAALQRDLEAILLSELCDEAEVDPSRE
jgi:hypothetical protein